MVDSYELLRSCEHICSAHFQPPSRRAAAAPPGALLGRQFSNFPAASRSFDRTFGIVPIGRPEPPGGRTAVLLSSRPPAQIHLRRGAMLVGFICAATGATRHGSRRAPAWQRAWAWAVRCRLGQRNIPCVHCARAHPARKPGRTQHMPLQAYAAGEGYSERRL